LLQGHPSYKGQDSYAKILENCPLVIRPFPPKATLLIKDRNHILSPCYKAFPTKGHPSYKGQESYAKILVNCPSQKRPHFHCRIAHYNHHDRCHHPSSFLKINLTNVHLVLNLQFVYNTHQILTFCFIQHTTHLNIRYINSMNIVLNDICYSFITKIK
jgi:hypothetical protein